MKITARSPGSCGEFIQGDIKGREMLISNTVNLYNQVTVCWGKTNRLLEQPAYKKMRRLLDELFAFVSEPSWKDKIHIQVTEGIPRSKGYASSTAHLSALLWAVCGLMDYPLSIQEKARLLTKVEPTDSTIFQPLTLFDNLKGQTAVTVGNLPGLSIVCFEGLEDVNTQQLKQQNQTRANRADAGKAAGLFCKALWAGDYKQMAAACMESARQNQKLLYKPYLEKMAEITERFGGLGLNIAHSGSLTGIWCADGKTDIEKIIDEVKRIYGTAFFNVRLLKTVNGGVCLI